MGKYFIGLFPVHKRLVKRHKIGYLLRICAEECQSGRMGRSRKPLCVRTYRGFESHLLLQLSFYELQLAGQLTNTESCAPKL